MSMVTQSTLATYLETQPVFAPIEQPYGQYREGANIGVCALEQLTSLPTVLIQPLEGPDLRSGESKPPVCQTTALLYPQMWIHSQSQSFERGWKGVKYHRYLVLSVQ